MHVKSFEDQFAYFESIEGKESLVDDDLKPIIPSSGDDCEEFKLNNDPEWKGNVALL